MDVGFSKVLPRDAVTAVTVKCDSHPSAARVGDLPGHTFSSVAALDAKKVDLWLEPRPSEDGHESP